MREMNDCSIAITLQNQVLVHQKIFVSKEMGRAKSGKIDQTISLDFYFDIIQHAISSFHLLRYLFITK